MLTKNGCGKPGKVLRILTLICTILLFASLCGFLLPVPVQAQERGETSDADGVAEPGILFSYAPGEVLVKFESTGAAQQAEALFDFLGVEGFLEKLGEAGEGFVALLQLEAGVAVERAARLLEQLAGVLYAEPNYLAHAGYSPTDPDYQPEQWGLNNYGQTIGGDAGTPGADISAQEAWDIEQGDTNPVTVAVIDSGIDSSHPDLDGKIWDNGDETPGNDIDDDGNGYVDDDAGFNWAGITQSRYYYYNYTEEQYYTTARYFGSQSDNRKRAQSLRGTGQELTHVGFILQKTGMTTGGITVSLRSSLDGADLSSFTISPAEVGLFRGEVYRELSSPVTLADGTTYYLVLETSNQDPTNCYYLYDNWGTYVAGTDRYDPYRDGQEYRWDGSVWLDAPYVDDDLYFHTNANPNPRDDNGHGTHVGGIAGAEEGNGQGGVGVSFGADLMPLKVLGSTGSGTYADIVSGIYYAADNGAEVINMSLSGSTESQAMQDAVDYAHSAGAVVFASVGNSGDTTVGYPAGLNNVIGVGATTNGDLKAGFSNHNSTVDLTAPGLLVYSTMPTYTVGLNSLGYAQDYDYLSGTSMSVPMAAGLAALVLSSQPAYLPQQVEWAIEAYADDLGSPGRDDYFGYGRINAFATLDGMGAPVIDNLDPPSDTIGEQVTVNGDAFGSNRVNSTVSFDGVQATQYDSWTDAAIVCRVPPGVSSQVQVTVTTPIATSNGSSFAVVPAIDFLDVSSGPVGTEVAITGSAFGATRGASYVSFGSVQAVSYTSWSDTQVVCRVPAGVSGDVLVTLTTDVGTSNDQPFFAGIDPAMRTWYLAEGSTAGGMETFILVQNPGDSEAEVNLTFITESGPQAGPSAVLPPGTRFTWRANDYITSYNVATTVSSDQPVVVERSMYGDNRTWAHDSIGYSP